MTLTDLLDDWTDRGITLWEDDGRLRYRAPRGVITREVVDALRSHKDDILIQLRSSGSGPRPHPDERYEPFPLTDVQAAYLMGRSTVFDYGGVACHLYCEVEYPRLDPVRATAAWQALIERHDMLRVRIDAAAFQRVSPDVGELTIPVVQLPSDNAADRAERLRQVRDRLSHAIHPTGSWPMFAVELTQPPNGPTGEPGRSIMHISFDFLVGDWASLLQLIREWEAEYAGLPIPEPSAVQFRDYVLWTRQSRGQGQYRRDRAYWSSRVPTLPSAPRLPMLATSPDATTGGPAPDAHAGAAWEGRSCLLPRAQWDRLAERAGVAGVTPTVAVLACYADVLSRWAESPHFCLNLTVLDRPQGLPELAGVVGDFTSVTLLEVTADDRPFVTRIQEMLRQLFTDLDHRSFSGVEVIRELSRTRSRDAAAMPYVFTSAIGLGHHSPDQPPSAAVPRAAMGFTISQTPQAFLDCQVMDDADGLHVHWDARQDVFPPGLLDDMFAAFTAALQSLADHNGDWQHSPVTLPRRQQLERNRANATDRPLPTGLLHTFFTDHVRNDPAAVAVLEADCRTSYLDLHRRAGAVAAALHSRGIGRGDRVAIAIPRSADQISAVLGTLMTGAAYVPLDLRHPDARREAICADADAAVVLTAQPGDRCGEDSAGDDGPTTIDVGALPDAPAAGVTAGPSTTVAPSDPAYIIYTSGSTGRPKGVQISHRAVVNTIMDVNQRYDIGDDDRTLTVADLGFDLSVYDIFGPLSVGGAVVVPPPDFVVDPAAWLRAAGTHRVTTMNTVPAVAQLMLTAIGHGATRPDAIRRWILSGDRIPRELVAELRRIFPTTRFVAMGGATEASIWSIAHDIDPDEPLDTDVPYGLPLANQRFAVLDAAGRDAPAGVSGELVIAGSGLADGYCNAPELTAASFVDHPRHGRIYRTGDRGHYLPGGEIAILGRIDDQVKVQGHRIELGEIENVLASHDAVRQAAVVTAGEGQQRRLHAFVVPEPARPARADKVAGRAATEAAGQASAEVEPHDAAGIGRYAAALDEAAAVSVTRALDEVRRGAPVAASHEWILDVWQQALQRRGNLPSADADPAVLWDRVAQLSPQGFDYRRFTEYVRRSADQLPALLAGRLPAHELLFPHGSREIAERVYQDRAIMRWGNTAITALISHLADQRPAAHPFRVLEVGAGTGSTTENVVAGLAGIDFRYTFTDRSEFFLPSARERWGNDDRWSFGTLDIDRSPAEQGFPVGCYDLVCAFGVLENSLDIARSLRSINTLTSPDGMVLISEPVDDQWWVYVSQIFLMTKPEHGSRPDHRLFPSRLWWQAQLQGIIGGQVITLPDADSPLAAENMSVFAVRRPATDSPAASRNITDFLAERLPSVMVPQHLEFLPELPLTRNGKINKSALAATAGLTTAETGMPVQPNGPDGAATARPATVDQQLSSDANAIAGCLADLWAAQLSLERRPALGQNPFDLGANSIIAANVAGRLREEVAHLGTSSFESVLRTLLTAPTIGAAAAELVQTAQPLATEQAPVVITTLRDQTAAGRTGRRVTVLLGDSLADTITGTRLNAALPQTAGTVVAVTVPDDQWFLDLPTDQATGAIADLAASNLVSLDADEYCLIGYSFGALVAIETARQLLEAGRHVLPLGLIDPHVVPAGADQDRVSEIMFLTTRGADLEVLFRNIRPSAAESAASGDPDDTPTLDDVLTWVARPHQREWPNAASTAPDGRVPTMLDQLSALTETERWQRYLTVVTAQSPVPTADPAVLRRQWLRYRHTMRAATLTPEPIVTDAVIVQPRNHPGFLPGAHERAADTWREIFIGTVETRQVDGDHFTLLDQHRAQTTGTAVVDGFSDLGATFL